MTIAMSRYGISVTYNCYNLKLRWGRKCPDKNTDKCFKCEYCKAEMSAKDATRLLDIFVKEINSIYKIEGKDLDEIKT